MSIWRSLLPNAGGKPSRTEQPIGGLAKIIDQRLRAQGLFVQIHAHGNSFYEIFASSSPNMIVLPDSAEASGIAILLAAAYDPPTVVFERINSIMPGLGRCMVVAVLDGLREHPGLFQRLRVNDLSPLQVDGRRWWEHIADMNQDFEWMITHDPDTTHSETSRT
jgi:hypothetical protein